MQNLDEFKICVQLKLVLSVKGCYSFSLEMKRMGKTVVSET